MLRLMLDSHPDLAIPGESHFIPPLWAARGRYVPGGAFRAARLASDIMRTPHFRLWGIPEEAVRRRIESLRAPGFAETVEAVFLAYADAHGKVRWGDKTPIYVLALPLLGALFPTARFVHLIRDGRDVALSYLSVPWGPTTIWQSARKWRRDVTSGRRSGRALGDRYLEIRYEDLVRDPREVLETVCAFTDLRFAEVMLDYHRDGEQRLQSPPDGVPFHAAAARPPIRGMRDWRSQMSSSDVRAFEAVAGDVLAELGYARRHATTPVTLRAHASLRVRSLDLWAVGSGAKKAVVRRLSGRPIATMDRG